MIVFLFNVEVDVSPNQVSQVSVIIIQFSKLLLTNADAITS